MSALVPRYYSGYPPEAYFNSTHQKKNYQNDKELLRQQPYFPFFYPPSSYNHTSLLPTSGYSPTNYNYHGQSGVNSTALIHSHRFHHPNQSQRTWPYINKTPRHYWKHPDSALPLSSYSNSFPRRHHNNPVYQYEREIRYLPYPVYGNPGTTGYPLGQNLGRGYGSISRYPAWTNTNYPNYGNVSHLPPKIRVIFIPPSSPCSQQSCPTALAMPPFLFNCMAQPLCSLPLPPPLPQISSLPLTPALQQMIMQQYANPVAVLPFTANWPASPPFMSSYPPFLPQQPMMSMPAMQLSQCIPQSYPLPLPLPPMMPMPAMQLSQCIPQSYPPVLPQQPMLSMPAIQPSQPVPQSYPPPDLLPPMTSMLPSNAPPSVPFSYPPSSIPPYSASSYPNICRACVPAPPPLSVAVRDHHWMQHCSACQHIPADASHPNARPNNGRITPLLRHPTVIQNVQDGGAQQQQYQYPHINTATDMARWSHKMPALPPGAVIISDEYINKNDLAAANRYLQKYPIQHPRVGKSVSRSVRLPTYSVNKNGRYKGGAQKQRPRNQQYLIKSQVKSTPKNIPTQPYLQPSNTYQSPKSSVTDQSSNISHQKPERQQHNNERNLVRRQLSAMERMINLRYNPQTPDLQDIYHFHDNSKLTDDDSTSLSNSNASSNHLNTKKINQQSRPLSVTFNAWKEENESEQEDEKSTRTRSPASLVSEQPKQRLIIIHQLRKNSPSTISMNSLNPSSIGNDKDLDSVSMTPSTKPNKDNNPTDKTP